MTEIPSQARPPFSPPPPELAREPLLAPRHGLGWLTDKVASVTEGPAPRWWKISFAISLCLLAVCFGSVAYLISTGVGVWGLNHPVMWGWAIINFVWWIGIGHAGTLISAILFLLRQRWRTSINRSAEAMTIFAVICAALFPIIHMGRAWFAWWLLPIPTSNALWPQFRSPLIWDVFAVSTYFTVSVLFCYLGLIPDLAILRDRAKTKARKIAYGLFALGWTGSNRHWSHYEKGYLILAGLSTALVLSVHSIVSLDFSVSQLPGWHSTIFPPYFVAGAIFSGLGMVLALLIPLRKILKLQDIITARHIDLMCKATLAVGCLVAYAYAVEFLSAWFSDQPLEKFAFLQNRVADPFIIAPLAGVNPAPYWWAYWIMILCNVLLPQLFWFKKIRARMAAVFVLAILVNVGMWFERFVIVVTALHRDFLPSNWVAHYAPTATDVLTFAGTFGLFLTLFLLFIRFLPMVAIAEVKGIQEPYCLPATEPPELFKTAPMQSAPWAVAAQFDTPASLLQAAGKIRDSGFRNWDVFTPFPVHGMDRAMGLKRSPVGWYAFFGGALGYAAGMWMIWWMNARNYPLLVGGKPAFSPWAALPPSFELAILFGAFAVFFGMLRANALPRLHHPLLKYASFARVSRDRFFLVIETEDPNYSPAQTPALLASLGGHNIEPVEE